MTSGLLGAILKVERAKKHIDDLKAVIKPWFASRPQTLKVEPDTDGIHELVKVVQVKEVPSDVNLIAGDAIHNLRSVLDIMLCSVARDIGISDLSTVEFPFAFSAKEFALPQKQAKITMLGASIVDWITSLKPYRGGDDYLHALHLLDCSDKHREILPMFFGSTEVLMVENSEGVLDEVPSLWCPFKREMVIERRVIGTYPNNTLKWRMQLSFESPTIVRNRPVGHLLDDLVKKVESIVGECERRDFVKAFNRLRH